MVSNVPGPAGARHLAGRRLVAAVAFAPVTGALGLGVTCVGYDGLGLRRGRLGHGRPVAPTGPVAGVTREFAEALAGDGFGERDA